MKKRAYMQGKKIGLRKPKRKHYFNHEFRHALKKMVVGGLASAIDHQIMYGTGS
jgi:hypothetical protein